MKPDKEYNGRSRIRMFNCDCMEFMAQAERYDLAIVDPPYGIGVDGAIHIKKPDRPSTWNGEEKYERKVWDDDIPTPFYFQELKRVSKNQIIWGGNYFTDMLPPKKGWVFWDKMFEKTNNFSNGELAWTSFDKRLMKFRISSKAGTRGGKDRIHPTQKPVKLYEWLLTNYAKEGDTIFDSHGGSMSIAIACWDLGFDLDICELDTDYFNDAVKRFENHISQTQLF